LPIFAIIFAKVFKRLVNFYKYLVKIIFFIVILFTFLFLKKVAFSYRIKIKRRRIKVILGVLLLSLLRCKNLKQHGDIKDVYSRAA